MERRGADEHVNFARSASGSPRGRFAAHFWTRVRIDGRNFLFSRLFRRRNDSTVCASPDLIREMMISGDKPSGVMLTFSPILLPSEIIWRNCMET